MKFRRLNCPQLHLPWLSQVLLIVTAVLYLHSSASAQPVRQDYALKPIGGPGGSSFVARCPVNELLTGIDVWYGKWIDAVRPICVPMKAGKKVTIYPQKFGGNGGKPAPLRFVCPADRPVVVGIKVRGQGKDTETVHDLGLFCGVAKEGIQDVYYDKEATVSMATSFSLGSGITQFGDWQACKLGYVAVGLTGRYGDWVDALGIVCGDWREIGVVGAKPEDEGVKPTGRINVNPNDRSEPKSICESSRLARSRNSPSAPGLESQCEALRKSLNFPGLTAKGNLIAQNDREYLDALLLQREGAARAGFLIGLGAADGQTQPGPGKQKIHDALPPEQQEGYNAAVTLSLLRNRRKYDDLAAKGQMLSSSNPSAGNLRSKQADNKARRGFDIGLAATEGQGAMTPETTKIRANLSPEELKGFDAAVSFSATQDREKTADAAGDLVPRGKILTNQDPLAVELRRQQPNADAQRGFDIGMAAAEGQTLPGPGKDKKRAALRLSEQLGFDAAVAFSLERNRYAERAKIGAYIASKDRGVNDLRQSEDDVFFRLGVDIASAIFGDRALGAQGNTQTGPGSLKIRDSLSPAGQRGFNAAVKLHLSRKY